MKVIRLFGQHDLRIQEEPVPEPQPGEKLIKVASVGICGSDLHWFAEQGIGDAKLDRPLVLGHEFTAVTESGERVAVDPSISCRKCEYCLHGHPNLCPQVRFAGHGSVDGALRECMAWEESCLYPIPDSITDEDGAMLEPLGVAIHAVNLAHLKVGMNVGVFGCGPIGLMVIQLARLSGAANIIATDILPYRLDAAKACGANQIFLAIEGASTEPLHSLTRINGLDVVFEVAGAQGAVDDAIAAAKPGGKVILVGIPSDDKTSFIASEARHKGLTIKLLRRMKHTYPPAIELVAKGLVDVRSLVTHSYPLEKVVEAFDAAERREGLKIMLAVTPKAGQV